MSRPQLADTRPLVLDAVIRVSRRNGRKGSSFISPAEQRRIITGWAEPRGITIAAWHDETDSVSGRTVNREGLRAAVRRAKAGETDGVIVAKVDRFARAHLAGMAAVKELCESKRAFISVKEGIEFRPGDSRNETRVGNLLLSLLLQMAEWQLDDLTEGWERTRQNHIANGVPNNTKYGYVKGEDRRLIRNPGKAEWVELIFKRRAGWVARPGAKSNRKRPAAWSWTEIADQLTAEGAPTEGGGSWAVSTVRQIVESRVYLGEIRSGDIVNEHAHQPLVSHDLWQAANSVSNSSQRNEAEFYPLTGGIRCAGCAALMRGSTHRKKYPDGRVEVYRYYRCRRHHGSWGICRAPADVRADEVEQLVEDLFVEKFLRRRPIVAEPSAATGELDRANTELAAAEAELDAFVTTAAALDAALFAKGVAVRQAKRDAARERVADARNAITGVALPANLADEWPSLDATAKQKFLGLAIGVVAVRRDRGPAVERIGIWTRDDPTLPQNLPGAGSSTELRTIDVPAGAGVPLG